MGKQKVTEIYPYLHYYERSPWTKFLIYSTVNTCTKCLSFQVLWTLLNTSTTKNFISTGRLLSHLSYRTRITFRRTHVELREQTNNVSHLWILSLTTQFTYVAIIITMGHVLTKTFFWPNGRQFFRGRRETTKRSNCSFQRRCKIKRKTTNTPHTQRTKHSNYKYI